MVSLNCTFLAGNLTADPVLTHIPSGTAVVEFNIAANRKQSNGHDEVLFMPVTVWGKLAEHCAKYLQKGSGILVKGSLRQDTWNNSEGQRRTTIKLVAESVQFVQRSKKTNPNGSENDHRYSQADAIPPTDL